MVAVATAPAAAAPAGPPPMTPELEKFSREIAERFPDLECKWFALPVPIRGCTSVCIRELLNQDTIKAAAQADALMSAIERASQRLTDAAEERETHRIALVGLGMDAGDGVVTYRHVNRDGLPVVELNQWPKRGWDILKIYFNQVNGLPWEDVGKGIREARTIGAFAPPTSGIPASAERGR